MVLPTRFPVAVMAAECVPEPVPGGRFTPRGSLNFDTYVLVTVPEALKSSPTSEPVSFPEELISVTPVPLPTDSLAVKEKSMVALPSDATVIVTGPEIFTG